MGCCSDSPLLDRRHCLSRLLGRLPLVQVRGPSLRPAIQKHLHQSRKILCQSFQKDDSARPDQQHPSRSRSGRLVASRRDFPRHEQASRHRRRTGSLRRTPLLCDTTCEYSPSFLRCVLLEASRSQPWQNSMSSTSEWNSALSLLSHLT